MNHKDEDLQKKFDDGNYSGDGVEEMAYQKVFNALKQEPEYTLPVYFADRLITLIEAKEKSRDMTRDNLWLGLGLFSLVVALVVAFALTDFKMSMGAFQFLAGYPGFVMFAVAFVMLLNWVDRKVVRKIEAFQV